MEKPSYFAVLPANVRYDDRLKPAEKLMYAELTCLAQKDGYAWASNGHFAELYGVAKETVSRWLSHLQQCGYIKVCLDYDVDKIRRILVFAPMGDQPPLTKTSREVDKNVKDTLDEKVKHNNTSINNKKEYSEVLIPDDFSPEMKEALTEWFTYKKERGDPYKPTGLKIFFTLVRNKLKEHQASEVIALIHESIGSNYKGITWDKLNRKKPEQQERKWRSLD